MWGNLLRPLIPLLEGISVYQCEQCEQCSVKFVQCVILIQFVILT